MAFVKHMQEEAAPTPTPFAVRALDEIEDGAHADILQGLYGGSTVIAMVGSPGAGKTTIGIDHGEHVAANESWFGLNVAGGPVVYFAAEAPTSVIMREKACATQKFPGRRVHSISLLALPNSAARSPAAQMPIGSSRRFGRSSRTREPR